EQAGHGDPAQRDRVSAALTALAGGLARDKKRGAYAAYAEAVDYLGGSAAPPDASRLLQIAADATILDVVPGAKQVGFEAQQLEDYFAGLAAAARTAPADTLPAAATALAVNATPAAMNAVLDSGHADAPL